MDVHTHTGLPTLFSAIAIGAINIIAQVTDVLPISNAYLSGLRELGSFGLVAFIVYWYATHVAPRSEVRFLEALSQQRIDYLEAQKTQRTDYLTARAVDNEKIERMIVAITELANSTNVHVEEARTVWKTREEKERDRKS